MSNRDGDNFRGRRKRGLMAQAKRKRRTIHAAKRERAKCPVHGGFVCGRECEYRAIQSNKRFPGSTA